MNQDKKIRNFLISDYGVAKDILRGDEQSQQDDGDTAAQILELELRARALKSLMKAQHNVDP